MKNTTIQESDEQQTTCLIHVKRQGLTGQQRHGNQPELDTEGGRHGF